MFEMENYEGDLTDIVRGSSSAYGCNKTEEPFSSDWKFLPSDSQVAPFHFSSSFSSLAMDQQQGSFGDPFCGAAMNLRDPLLQEQLDNNNLCGNSSSSSSSASSTFFNGDELIKRPSNIFSRMLQISPNSTSSNKFSPISPSPPSDNSLNLLPNSNHSPTPLLIHPNSDALHHHFIDNPAAAVHISSPRNAAGIKRRKSQARKVVCVPAPVAASSRPNGEVIPSDLWAWRKYGQKPIKGSPYPRGYYRCSSSKGCSARKQVERSRTDPNMLVITYTSEHNHPWPTQRNALAGSSRSQQSKQNTTNNNSSKLLSQPQKPTTPEGGDKKELEDHHNNNNHNAKSSASNYSVKEEVVEEIHDQKQQFEEAEDGELLLFSEGFPYRMGIMSNNNQSDDFFADLEELETDPLNLLFAQGQKDNQSDVIGSFNNLFDWAAENHNNNSNSDSTPFEEAAGAERKRGFY